MAEIKGEKPARTDKPWGYELLFAHTDKYAGKVIFVKQGHRLSFQYHERKDETVYVYDGELRMTVGSDATVLHSGEFIHLTPGTRHRMEAVRDTYIFEVSTPELEDVVRLADDYGRAGATG